MAKKNVVSSPKTLWIAIVPTATLAAVLIWISVFAFWLSGTVFNQQFFVGTTTSAIKSTESREIIAKTVVSRFLSEYPLIQTLIGKTANKTVFDLLDSTQMEFVYRKAAEEVFYQLTDPNPKEVSIDLGKVTRFAPLIQRINPEVGSSLGELPEKVVILPKGEIPSLYQYKLLANFGGPSAIGIAILLVGLVLFLAKSIGAKLKALGIVGLLVGLIGAVIYFGLPIVEEVVVSQLVNPLVLAIGGQILDTFIQNLRTQVFNFMVGGIVVGIIGLTGGFIAGRIKRS